MGKRGRYVKGGWIPPKPEMERAQRGSILGPGGDVISTPGEFDFKEGEPRADEIVYELWETVQPQPAFRRTGETFAIQLPVPPGWMFCTAKIPGQNNPNDCMLVFLRGEAPPPKGTRFVLRMLRPETTERSDATQNAEDQSRQEAEGSQSNERVQGQEPQVVERQEGDEPQTGDSNRALGERTEPETPEEEVVRFIREFRQAQATGMTTIITPIAVIERILQTGRSFRSRLMENPEAAALFAEFKR